MGIIKKNSIILLDEAHNICNIFEGLFTQKIQLEDIEQLQDLLQLIYDENNLDMPYSKINDEINNIKKFILKIKELNLEKDNNFHKIDENFYECNLSYFKKKLELFYNSFNFYDLLDSKINNLEKKIINSLEEKYNKNPSYKKTTFKSIMEKPKKFYYFFNLLNNIINDKSEISFKFLFKQNEEHTEYIFEIYCIDASYGMKNLLTIKPYSIILTSGTLFIGSLETLLGVKFKEKLNNKHVIDNS